MHFLINMALGLFMALTGFTFSLWSFIRSYSPDFLTGLFFFFGAVIAATSMVATYLTLLYGTAGATVFVGVKALLNNANRLEQGGEGGRGGPRRNLHHE
jgi:prepilin signal peptidase PulO-like enzyme (type II secretory pathway)